MNKLKLMLLSLVSVFILAACSQEPANNEVEARAIYEIAYVMVDEVEVPVEETFFDGATITFVGPLEGGNVLFLIGDNLVQASVNPSESHPSFADGVWHHHLYAGSTEQGSERINFMELLPELGIDDNEETDNTSSSFQRGNLHYIVETGEYRLRFTIDGAVYEGFFVEV